MSAPRALTWAGRRRALDTTAMSEGDGLVPQTDPQQRNRLLLGETDHLDRAARILRTSRAGRNDDRVGPESGDFDRVEAIITRDLDLRVDLPHRLNQVVGKRVVV